MYKLVNKKIKEIFGENYELVSMEGILGGAQKHTYRAVCSNGFSFVVYQWDQSTTYFEKNDADIFCSSSAELFQLNNALMRENHVLTPELYYMDKSRLEGDFEYAFVEYIDGHDMDYIKEHQPERLPAIWESLRRIITHLHNIKSNCPGQLERMLDADFDIGSYELNGMRENCLYLQKHDPEYEKYYLNAYNKAKEYLNKFKKRDSYRFIHGELGPNHVMVDANNNAYLIDIEGAKFCDVEEELGFLNMRFDEKVYSSSYDIDENRMLFYYIGHCFGNMSGAIELKEKNYYDMDDINGMIHFFHEQFRMLEK